MTIKKAVNYNGLFQNGNALGICSAINIVLSIYLITNSKFKMEKGVLFVNILIQTYALAFSGGRSAFLIIATFICLLIFIKYKSKLLGSLLILIPSATFFSLLFLTPKFTRYVFAGRENIWVASFNLIEKYPLFGVGQSNLLPTIDSLKEAWLYGVEYGGLHNIYLQVAAINGLPSLIILLIILSTIVI